MRGAIGGRARVARPAEALDTSAFTPASARPEGCAALWAATGVKLWAPRTRESSLRHAPLTARSPIARTCLDLSLPTQPTTADAVLTTDRAAQLDHLLNQTDMYTKFLSEQMQSIEEKTEAEAAAEAVAKAGGVGPAAKKARKGSAGPARASAAGGANRGKAPAVSPTEVNWFGRCWQPLWRGVRAGWVVGSAPAAAGCMAVSACGADERVGPRAHHLPLSFPCLSSLPHHRSSCPSSRASCGTTSSRESSG